MWLRDSFTDAPAGEPSVTADFAGCRILLVEDSPVVGPFTADILADLGCAVVGPAPNMSAARELIDEEQFDAAILTLPSGGAAVFRCSTCSKRATCRSS